MTRQWKWVSLIILSLTASACSSIIPGFHNTSNVTGTANPSTAAAPPVSTSTPGSPATSVSPATTELNKRAALEAYQAVLNNKKEFQSTENKKNKYLKDFLSNNELYGTTPIAIDRFAVVDMDGDEVPELVLGLTVENNSTFTEVLQYQDGEVYGSFFGRDQIVELKSDGSYRWLSGGMTNNGITKLYFRSHTAVPYNLAYLESKATDDAYTTFTTTYYINDQIVTKESYTAYVTEQEAKKDVAWRELTKANIDNLITTSADGPSPK